MPMAETPHIAKLLVIGVGLIGGSLARALREAGVVGTVSGLGRSRETLARARELGVIDDYHEDYAAAADGAGLVLIATPVGASAAVLEALAPVLPPYTVVTDAGSVKQRVIAEARAALGAAFPRFVGGHPIAGNEHSGINAADATLFREHLTVLTPTADTDPAALATVRRVWAAAGSTVIELEAAHHDRILAATSHLPHIAAYALVTHLGDRVDQAELARFFAGGLRDFTRVASSDPEMWSDICLANREPLLALIEDYGDAVARLAALVRDADRDGLYSLFARARAQRDAWCAAPASGAPAPPKR